MISELAGSNVYWAFETAGLGNIDLEISQAGTKLGLILITPDTSQKDYEALENASVIQILDGNYEDWNDIYGDIQTVWNNQQGDLKMKTLNTATMPNDLKVLKSNSNVFLAIHDITDLEKELSKNKAFYEMFGGVMLDYEYLYSLDNNSLETFKDFLEEKELEVVVDFLRSIDHFIDLTLMNQVEENYLRSKAKIDNVFEKMEQLDIDHAMIVSEPFPEANGRDPETGVAAPWGEWGESEENALKSLYKGIEELTQRASEKNITLHMQNTAVRNLASIGEVKNVVNTVGKDNLKVAVNGNYTRNLRGDLASANEVEIIIIGGPGSLGNSIQPFYQSGQNPEFLDNYRSAIKILDGGYKSWNQIEEEYEYIREYVKCGEFINGDFESGNKTPWVGYGNVMTEAKKDGNYGYLLDGLFMQQELYGLQEGTTYSVKVDINSTGENQGYVFIKEYGGEEVRQSIETQEGWQEYTLEFTMGKERLVKIGFMREPNKGIVHLDNFRIEPKDQQITMIPITTSSAISVTTASAIKLNLLEIVELGQKDLPKEMETETIVWTSQNSQVALVDKRGRLTAVGIGETIIVGTIEEYGIVRIYQVQVVEDNPQSEVAIHNEKIDE